MKISFVVPVYCVEKYVAECIRSLLEQTYQNIEIVLVNDGSKDSSGRICDEYAEKDKRIVVVHQENSGVSAARNAGLKVAQGDWVCFIDGDDAVLPELCQEVMPHLDVDRQICFFGHQEVQSNIFSSQLKKKNSIKSVVNLEKEDFEEFQKAAFNRDYPGKYDYYKVKLSTPCKFYNRKFLLDHRIEFPVGVPTGEDCLFNLHVYRYAQKGVYLEFDPYLHRIWGQSVSQKYNPKVYDDFALLHRLMKQYINEVGNNNEFLDVYNQRCIWSLGFCCILNYCHPDNPEVYGKRKKEFLNSLGSEMGKAAEKADLSYFRIEKKILFWLIKKKQFALVNILCWLKRKMEK